MAIIQSGASADLLTIDPASNAARATLYTNQGAPVLVDTAPSGSYFLPINVRQTTAAVAASTVWTLYNPSGSGKTVYLRALRLLISFDGTAAAATTPRYSLSRFSGAAPTGGAALTIIKKRTADPSSVVSDARILDTGLTTTGITFETALAQVGLPISVTGGFTQFAIERTYPFLELEPGEGFAIRTVTAMVIGMVLNGDIEWDEN